MRLKCVRAFAVLILACVCSVGVGHCGARRTGCGARSITTTWSVLKGSIHMLARPEFERGLVDPDQRISGVSLDLQPTAEQQAALDTFLEGQRDPGSADFQRWLTPEEFGDGFGVNEADLAQVTSWITAQGLTVEHVGEARNWIMFGGTAEQLGRAFHTSLRYYRSERGDALWQRHGALGSGGIRGHGAVDPVSGRFPAATGAKYDARRHR